MENKELEKKLDIAIENFLQDYDEEETLISLSLVENKIEGLNTFTQYITVLQNTELDKLTHTITILDRANANLALENMLHTEIYENLDKVSLIAILTSDDYDGFGRYLKEKHIDIPDMENITMSKLQLFFAKHFEVYVNYNKDFFGYECFSETGDSEMVIIDGEEYFLFLNNLKY